MRPIGERACGGSVLFVFVAVCGQRVRAGWTLWVLVAAEVGAVAAIGEPGLRRLPLSDYVAAGWPLAAELVGAAMRVTVGTHPRFGVEADRQGPERAAAGAFGAGWRVTRERRSETLGFAAVAADRFAAGGEDPPPAPAVSVGNEEPTERTATPSLTALPITARL